MSEVIDGDLYIAEESCLACETLIRVGFHGSKKILFSGRFWAKRLSAADYFNSADAAVRRAAVEIDTGFIFGADSLKPEPRPGRDGLDFIAAANGYFYGHVSFPKRPRCYKPACVSSQGYQKHLRLSMMFACEFCWLGQKW